MCMMMDVYSGRIYMTMPDENGGISEMIAVRESEAVYHMYSRESNGDWVDDGTVEQNMYEDICGDIIRVLTSFADEYDSFKYDSKLDAYVHITNNTIVTFKDGKLYTLMITEGEEEQMLLFTDYDNTVIEIPNVKDPEVK